MTAINPDKYVRKAFIEAIGAVSSIPVYDTSAPIDDDTVTQYFTIQSQTKNRFGINKQFHEWDCTIAIHCWFENEKGFNSMSAVEDMEELISEALSNGITVDGFVVKLCNFDSSVTANLETQTLTVNRKVVTYRLWLNRATR